MASRARALGLISLLLPLSACSGGSTTPGTDAGGVDPGTDAGPPPPPGADDLPCDAREVVVTHCQTCHAAVPQFGAPMPLIDTADFLAPTPSMPSVPVHQRAAVRIHDGTAPMPPVSQPRLSAPELSTLDAWLAAGAPARAAGTTCEDPPPPPPPDELPCTPTHTFLAHAAGSTDPYTLGPGEPNQNICFIYRSPFSQTQQATAWGPVTDDARVLHHWILWRTQSAQVDGRVGPCNMPGDQQFVMGWAPGGGVYVMPDDVGLELRQTTGDEYLILEMHYNNAAGHTDVTDASGVQVCVTDTPRAQEAGILAFGTTAITLPPRSTGVSTTGTCGSFLTRLLPSPLTVLSSGPHMHQLGTSFRTELLPGGSGAPVVMVDVDPWSFDDQIAYRYPEPMVINPGDAVRTTCTYSNPGESTVTFGERTEDEMCFNFMMVYPISAIPDGTPRYCSDR